MPSTPQMLEAIKEKIITACPELMEMSYGCEVEFSVTGYKEQMFITSRMCDDSAFYTNGNVEKFEKGDGRFKILGHPITLEHVLKTLSNKWRTHFGTNPVDGKKHRNVFGGDRVLREGELLYSICSKWDLTLPLSQQSEPTIKFLHEILCPNSKQ